MTSKHTKVTVNINTSTRVFSPTQDSTPRSPVRTTLSIIEVSCANFTPTGALWFFERPASLSTFSIETLSASLSITLQDWPQYSGRLRRVHCDDDLSRADGTAFYNRLDVWYGDSRAPGVAFASASSDTRLDDIMPSPQEQTHRKIWHTTDMPREDVFLQNSIANAMTAPTEDSEVPSDPVMAVQVTHLACGGMVLGVKVSHPLADAHTLALFVNDWSRTHTSVLANVPPARSTSTFAPHLIDDAATRALEQSTPESLLEIALSGPMHRYDWWAPGAPFTSAATTPPTILARNASTLPPIRKPNEPAWHEWDRTAPVQHVVLSFPRARLEDLRATATTDGGVRPSTLVALLAHIWAAITRARFPSPPSQTSPSRDASGHVHAHLSFSLRPRLSPPLPPTFAGSPIANTSFTLPLTSLVKPSLPVIAGHISATLAKLTPTFLAAHIYGVTRESTPQRVWQLFLGKRHVLMTSWVRAGVYGADFGGAGARYAHPVMPAVDGCVAVVEGAEGEGGLSVHVYLTEEAMGRLARDEEL